MLGMDAGEAIPDLMDTLKDPEKLVRVHSATAILLIKPAPTKERVPALILLLTEETQKDFKKILIEDLGKLGSLAQDAIPVLSKALNDPDQDVKKAAAEALERIKNHLPPTS
jgi:HEAT repeat protein